MTSQGLYPGYIIFFVQSALMIAGSRGTYLAILAIDQANLALIYFSSKHVLSIHSHLQMATSYTRYSVREDTNVNELRIHTIGFKLLCRWLHG